MKNADRPAFTESVEIDPNDIRERFTGLTKREYFAALAMQGLLANKRYGRHYTTQEVVESSVIISDELLKQLEF